MEEIDKSLGEQATGLFLATTFLGLTTLVMIRFGYTRPDNDIWKCLLFALKGCACGWFYLWGRYSVKEILRAQIVNCELKIQHTEEKLHDQKIHCDEKLSYCKLKVETLKYELEAFRRREEALAQKLNASSRTPAEVNQNALKSFL